MATFAQRLPLKAKNLFMHGMGEFVGTFLFIFFALGGVNTVNTAGSQSKDFVLASDPSQLLYICISFGASLAVTVWLFFRVTGGLFNPAITLSLFLVGAIDIARAIVVFIAQILGGMAAAGLLSGLYPGALQVSTTKRDDVNLARALFIEVFATSILALAVLMMAVEKHRATFMAPACIGLALFIAELVSIPWSGGSINPARSFGPCVATRSFTTYHWIYWVGPGLGGMLAAAFYKLIKVLEYETVNPGQDDDGLSLPSTEPSHQYAIKEEGGFLQPQQRQPGTANGARLSGDTRFDQNHVSA